MQTYELDTPALTIDIDVVERNLSRMAEYSRLQGLSLRPHTKTHKIPEFASRQLELGAVGITVAKVDEAEIMVDNGIHDILVAYPIVSPVKADRLARLCGRARITASLDSQEAVQCLARSTRDQGTKVRVLIEVDVGFHRCGVQDEKEALALARAVLDCPSLEFQGIMFYPGSYVLHEDQDDHLQKVNAQLEKLSECFRKAGIPTPVVSGGSTPSARFSHRFTGITEIRPGTYIFNDRNTILHKAAQIEDCAASVLVTVVSTAVPGKAIIDGGSKTFSADASSSGAKGFGLVKEDPDAVFEFMNEEHGFLNISRSTRRYRIGEKLLVVPNHVCTMVNMHDSAYLTQAGEVRGACPIAARGRLR